MNNGTLFIGIMLIALACHYFDEAATRRRVKREREQRGQGDGLKW
jgi:hypothetical protein